MCRLILTRTLLSVGLLASCKAADVAGWLRSIWEGSAMDVVKAAQDAEKAVDFLTASIPAGRTWHE